MKLPLITATKYHSQYGIEPSMGCEDIDDCEEIEKEMDRYADRRERLLPYWFVLFNRARNQGLSSKEEARLADLESMINGTYQAENECQNKWRDEYCEYHDSDDEN